MSHPQPLSQYDRKQGKFHIHASSRHSKVDLTLEEQIQLAQLRQSSKLDIKKAQFDIEGSNKLFNIESSKSSVANLALNNNKFTIKLQGGR